MKVQHTAGTDSVYQGTERSKTEQAENGKNGKNTGQEQIKNGTLFAGNLNLIEDPIAKKREEARKEAMGLISDQFQIDSGVDSDLDDRRNHIDELQEGNRYARDQISRLQEDKCRMIEEYGVEEGSQDLIDIEKEIKHWQAELQKGEGSIEAEVYAIYSTKQAMLERTHDMRDAAGAAEDVMAAASDEIIGMLKQEALDKMEEDKKEEQEKIEEAEEKKEEQEELIEDKREQENVEELTKQTVQAETSMDKEELQRQIQEILAKQKLLEEELKGITVDVMG